jgi:acyl-CoA reductase-like NAD-dependent aldehyde dehydrogenase
VDTAEQAVEVTNRIQYRVDLIDSGRRHLNVNSSTVTDEIHPPMGGVRSSGWRRTGPECLADFSDIVWINTTTAERQFPV